MTNLPPPYDPEKARVLKNWLKIHVLYFPNARNFTWNTNCTSNPRRSPCHLDHASPSLVFLTLSNY